MRPASAVLAFTKILKLARSSCAKLRRCCCCDNSKLSVLSQLRVNSPSGSSKLCKLTPTCAWSPTDMKRGIMGCTTTASLIIICSLAAPICWALKATAINRTWPLNWGKSKLMVTLPWASTGARSLTKASGFTKVLKGATSEPPAPSPSPPKCTRRFSPSWCWIKCPYKSMMLKERRRLARKWANGLGEA